MHFKLMLLALAAVKVLAEPIPLGYFKKSSTHTQASYLSNDRGTSIDSSTLLMPRDHTKVTDTTGTSTFMPTAEVHLKKHNTHMLFWRKNKSTLDILGSNWDPSLFAGGDGLKEQLKPCGHIKHWKYEGDNDWDFHVHAQLNGYKPDCVNEAVKNAGGPKVDTRSLVARDNNDYNDGMAMTSSDDPGLQVDSPSMPAPEEVSSTTTVEQTMENGTADSQNTTDNNTISADSQNMANSTSLLQLDDSVSWAFEPVNSQTSEILKQIMPSVTIPPVVLSAGTYFTHRWIQARIGTTAANPEEGLSTDTYQATTRAIFEKEVQRVAEAGGRMPEQALEAAQKLERDVAEQTKRFLARGGQNSPPSTETIENAVANTFVRKDQGWRDELIQQMEKGLEHQSPVEAADMAPKAEANPDEGSDWSTLHSSTDGDAGSDITRAPLSNAAPPPAAAPAVAAPAPAPVPPPVSPAPEGGSEADAGSDWSTLDTASDHSGDSGLALASVVPGLAGLHNGFNYHHENHDDHHKNKDHQHSDEHGDEDHKDKKGKHHKSKNEHHHTTKATSTSSSTSTTSTTTSKKHHKTTMHTTTTKKHHKTSTTTSSKHHKSTTTSTATATAKPSASATSTKLGKKAQAFTIYGSNFHLSSTSSSSSPDKTDKTNKEDLTAALSQTLESSLGNCGSLSNFVLHQGSELVKRKHKQKQKQHASSTTSATSAGWEFSVSGELRGHKKLDKKCVEEAIAAAGGPKKVQGL